MQFTVLVIGTLKLPTVNPIIGPPMIILAFSVRLSLYLFTICLNSVPLRTITFACSLKLLPVMVTIRSIDGSPSITALLI